METSLQSPVAFASFMRRTVRRWRRALVLGIPALLSLPSFALALPCGTLVTRDVTLTADMLNCPDTGLLVRGSSGITINLNGHRITGAAGSSSGIGILSSAKVQLVGGGEIYGFNAGISVNNSRQIAIENLHLHHNRANNIYLLKVTDSLVVYNRLEDSTNGVVVDGAGYSKDNLIQYNVITDNVTGVFLRGTDQNRVISNTIRDNSAGLGISSGSDNLVDANGIHSNLNGVVIENTAPPFTGAHRNRVTGNKIYGNTLGVILREPYGSKAYNKYNEIKDNVFSGGATGVEVYGPRNYGTGIYDNRLRGVSVTNFDDTGTATGYAGNICTPGPC
ncbi:MAG: right-handed parallel beta-helix repeat-containing protein [Pseudomonadota bacterium]